jgi:hypothetical protein
LLCLRSIRTCRELRTWRRFWDPKGIFWGGASTCAETRGGKTRSRSGIDFAHSPPCDHKVPVLAFGVAGLESFGRLCCTGLRASWSELAYVRPLFASETERRAHSAVRGLGGCNKRRRPRKFVIWRAGCSGRRARRRECREKGFSFSELARRPAQLPQPVSLEAPLHRAKTPTAAINYKPQATTTPL